MQRKKDGKKKDGKKKGWKVKGWEEKKDGIFALTSTAK